MPTFSKPALRIATFALTCALPLVAQAQSSDDANGDKLQVNVGSYKTTSMLTKGVLVDARSGLLLDVEYSHGPWYASVQNGVGYKVLNSSQWELGLGLNYMPGRFAKYDNAYQGLGDVAGSAAAYAYVDWRPVKDAVTVYGSAERSLQSANGTVATLGATLGIPIYHQFNGYVDVVATYGSGSYNQRFYGVTPTQSASSGYASFNAGAGWVSVAPTMGLVYKFNRQWTVVGYAGRARLSSAVSTSQIAQGRQNQALRGLLVSWTY